MSFQSHHLKGLQRISGQNPWILASAVVAITVVGFLLSSRQFFHWFLAPVALCGVLTAKEAAGWLSGKVHAFDALGVFGMFGVFFFFLAPLLHVSWNFWMWEVVGPPDWRDWLGRMAILNVAGLLAFRSVFYLCSTDARPNPPKFTWVIDFRVFPLIAACILLLTATLQSWVYVRSGGIAAFIELFHESYQTNEDHFAGWGWIFMISESFPIIAAIVAIAYAHRKRFRPDWLQFGACLLLFFSFQLYFGGLRGSRLNTAEGLFWAVGAFHFFVKPISRSVIVAGVLSLVGFMYVYGFYKDGAKVSAAFENNAVREAVQQKSHRSLDGLLLGDLGRADVQAYLLYKTVMDPYGFRRAGGQTYLSGLCLFVPQRFRPSSLVNKESLGSDLIWGAGVYTPGVLRSTRIHGLAGEAILNFGYFSVPIAFAVLAWVIVQVQRWICSFESHDARLLLAPFAIYLTCVWSVCSDFDNVVFSIIKQGFVAGLFVLLSCKRVRIARSIPGVFAYAQTR